MTRWSVKALLRLAAKRLQPDAHDLDPAFRPIWERCRPFTMTSIERGFALYKATEYVVRAGIPGDFVECGVWRGGSAMIAALTLLHLGDTSRILYLYDTYAGMAEPGEKDVSIHNSRATDRWASMQKGNVNEWCYAGIEDVTANLRSTGYPDDRLRFVAGKVEETIPGRAPDAVALLRLDTDWYESTYHELRHLYPRLAQRGVLILDDYGHWKGAREATDQYLSESGIPLLLNRIDGTGRIALKA